jgi:hypothetical protein
MEVGNRILRFCMCVPGVGRGSAEGPALFAGRDACVLAVLGGVSGGWCGRGGTGECRLCWHAQDSERDRCRSR